MSAWHWPQWVVIVFIGLMVVLFTVPSKNHPYGSITAATYAALGWVLWMGGFWP